MAGLIGRKLGMTRVYDDAGRQVPVTVLQVGPCHVSQVKTPERDGYAALQLAFEDVKPRRSTLPLIGHDAAAGLTAKRYHREVRVDEGELDGFEPGQVLSVDVFEGVKFVDVTGTSKGKGTAGVMKRHNFKGLLSSHGTERKHRSPGSIGGHASNAGKSGKIKKGKRMAGRLGNERVTVRSLDVVGSDKDNHLLLVKGPVPGPRGGLILVRQATRLYKAKATLARAS